MRKAFVISLSLIAVMTVIIIFGVYQSHHVTSIPGVVDRTDTEASDSTSPCKTIEARTILYCDSGFSDYLNVVEGETVIVKNSSSSTLNFESDPSSANPTLSLGTIDPGQSKTFVAKPLGTWQFHNANAQSHTGTIGILDDL